MTDPDRLALVRKALAIDSGRDCDRLGWLSALLHDAVLSGWADNHEDVSAAYETINECQALLDGLTAAFQDEIDALAEAERAAPGEGPGPGDEQLPF